MSKSVFCLHCRHFASQSFAWNVKSCFLGKIRKKISPLSSTELAQRVVKVKALYTFSSPYNLNKVDGVTYPFMSSGFYRLEIWTDPIRISRGILKYYSLMANSADPD